MCRCRPEVKTPFCGRVGCTWPPLLKVPLAPEVISREQVYLEALKREAIEKWQRQNLGEDYPTLVYVGGLRFVVTKDGKAELVLE